MQMNKDEYRSVSPLVMSVSLAFKPMHSLRHNQGPAAHFIPHIGGPVHERRHNAPLRTYQSPTEVNIGTSPVSLRFRPVLDPYIQ